MMWESKYPIYHYKECNLAVDNIAECVNEKNGTVCDKIKVLIGTLQYNINV